MKDILKRDFRPVENSLIIDRGILVPFADIIYEGKAPDNGAYESGGENWIPGAKWNENTQWMIILAKKK